MMNENLNLTLGAVMQILVKTDPSIYGTYYVYPDGSFWNAEDITPDELIFDGYSDDFITTPLPHDESGYPYIPGEFL